MRPFFCTRIKTSSGFCVGIFLLVPILVFKLVFQLNLVPNFGVYYTLNYPPIFFDGKCGHIFLFPCVAKYFCFFSIGYVIKTTHQVQA